MKRFVDKLALHANQFLTLVMVGATVLFGLGSVFAIMRLVIAIRQTASTGMILVWGIGTMCGVLGVVGCWANVRILQARRLLGSTIASMEREGKSRTGPNNTSEGIGQPADGLPKPSM